ncbi:hypothetical protein CEP71_006930 [Escherichia coli O157]|nr:hypothetical protein [Escherichia coli]PNL73516.1 hypothetical protein CEP71_006930 [Escherichia coli O157]QCH85512.1 hypothetical protein CAM50_0009235 [Escherichia coli O157:H7]PJG34221.1 hypothetical protein CVH05_07720 [Escherichia coli]QCL56535.1 hypothetical protein C9E66_09475 [Escherichia coli]
MTDFGGKTSIFSHPVYLFLREFSLQDFRGGSGQGVLADQQKYTGPYLCRKRQFCGGRDPPGDAGPCRI